MKRSISFILVFLIMIALLPSAFAEDNAFAEYDEEVSLWKDVKKLYTSHSDLFAVTEDGKVLTTSSVLTDVKNWTEIISLCPGFFGDILFGVRSDGSVLGIGTEGNADAVKEVSGWTNVAELHCCGNGFYALLSDGSLVCTEDLKEDFKALRSQKLKSIEVFQSFRCAWAAVTQNGQVITGEEHLRDQTDKWNGIERLWLISYYNGSFLVGRKTNGSTVMAVRDYSDYFAEDPDASSIYKRNTLFFTKQKDIRDILYNYENDFFAVLTDDGTASLNWMADFCFDYDFDVPDYAFENVKAESMTALYSVCAENSDRFTDSFKPLFVFLTKDGTIPDSMYDDTLFRFKPVIEDTVIRQLVSFDNEETSILFGLTEDGKVTRIRILEDGTKDFGRNGGSGGTPSEADLDAIKTKIRYPKPSGYLEEYISGTICPSAGKTAVYAFGSSSGSVKLCTIDGGTRVTVLAKENGRYCVIAENGKAYWINVKYISAD